MELSILIRRAVKIFQRDWVSHIPVLLQLQSNFTQNPEAYSQLQEAFTQNPDFSQLKGGLTQGDFYSQQVRQDAYLSNTMQDPLSTLVKRTKSLISSLK